MFLCIIALIIVAVSNAQEAEQNISCSAYIRCSFFEEPVWATDGKCCFVFRNSCLLQIENCDREFYNKPLLEILSEEKCQLLCKTKCPKVKKPVCATYNDVQMDFVNRCLMELHSCKTGEVFSNVADGPCSA